MSDNYEEYIPFAYLDDTEDDYCEHCGTRLKKHRESHPYGDTSYSVVEYYCHNCG